MLYQSGYYNFRDYHIMLTFAHIRHKNFTPQTAGQAAKAAKIFSVFL